MTELKIFKEQSVELLKEFGFEYKGVKKSANDTEFVDVYCDDEGHVIHAADKDICSLYFIVECISRIEANKALKYYTDHVKGKLSNLIEKL